MADERIQDKGGQGTTGAMPGKPGERSPGTELSRKEVLDRSVYASETVLMVRWTAGLVLVLVCGWGLILAAALVAPSLGVSSLLLVVVAAAISFGLLWVLERNLWLSRFMGLRLSNVSAQWKETAFLWLTGVVGLLFRSTETPRPDPTHVQPSAENSSVREIAETIVFVVVLVLLLKTFAAEAFVIPTGSMATTLWGYQKYVNCPKCGYHFPVNCSREVEGTGDELGNQTHIATEGAICPNCHYPIDFVREGIRPSCQTGDRVLVDKPLYDIHMANPTPMDVVVFKYPEAPQSDYTPMNYIKRLAGTGGHTYGIYYGKLYVGDANKVPNWDDADKYPDPELERRPDQSWDEAVHEWKSRYKQNMKRMMHTGEYDTADLAGRLKEGKDFTIFRRPLHAVLAQRRIVYDNDHPASDLSDAYQRWVGGAESRWANANDHGFHHDAGQAGKVDWLRYRNVLRCSPTDSHGKPKPELITDLMGYNTEMTRQGTQSPGENWVGDLMFECDVTVEEATGDLVLELSKGTDRFRARWDLATGICTLLRATGDQNDGYRVNADDEKAFQALGEPQSTSLKRKGHYHLRFANMDERLIVWVDGKRPFGNGVEYAAPSQRGPWSNDLEPVSIGLRQGAVSVHHLVLWRDTYYTQAPGTADCADLNKADTDSELHAMLSDPNEWGSLRNLAAETFYVQPNHYFCLGDNSPESSDSRYWGLVPKRLMLGRALFVYWPAWPVSPTTRIGPIK